jgi:hypothetical protein
MRARLSDAEFIEKARASARRRSERQRLRKLESGKVQANFWLPVDAKNRVEQLATELNSSPSEVATAAILAYLATARPAVSSVSPRAERDTAILALHREGKGLSEIARLLAAQGITTATGKPLSGDTVSQAIKRAGLVTTKEDAE